LKILFIADVRNWVFDNIGKMLQKYGSNTYTVRYGRKSKYKKCWKNLDQFDLVLFPVDTRPDRVIKDHKIIVPPEKLVMMIRCDVFQLCKPKRLAYYESTKLMNRRVKAFLCSNKALYDVFRKKYNRPCYYAPGGVDTELFKPPTAKVWNNPPRVGWAGSRDFFGKERRGIDLIEEAVKQLGWIWNPAYREDKWRTPEEMVKYYQEEIDIYIDCDRAPGRQNGLLEAGACGLPLVCTKHGIGNKLVYARQVERNVSAIKQGLRSTYHTFYIEYKENPVFKKWNYNIALAEEIKSRWSWQHHIKLWEEMFLKIVRNGE